MFLHLLWFQGIEMSSLILIEAHVIATLALLRAQPHLNWLFMFS
jgi:hypothetical protein